MGSIRKDGRLYVSRRLLCRGEKFVLYRDRLRWPGGKKVFREWAMRPRISAVIAVPEKGRMLLVRQHRYGVNEHLWEIPAGTVHGAESPGDCAVRECEEETGWKPGRVRSLGFFFPTPAFADERVFLFAADRLKKTRMDLDFDEVIRVKSFPESRVRKMLKQGVIKDAKSIIALYRYFGV